jgi:4'-phosphopantetheinyl transferase EntD
MLLFSAKEAFYKVQYPITQAFLDFQQVELLPTTDGRFDVTRVVGDVVVEALGAGRIVGRWMRLRGLVATGATWLNTRPPTARP